MLTYVCKLKGLLETTKNDIDSETNLEELVHLAQESMKESWPQPEGKNDLNDLHWNIVIAVALLAIVHEKPRTLKRIMEHIGAILVICNGTFANFNATLKCMRANYQHLK